MKWELTEPQCGDMIRVKAGSIHHYGVYVSDDEVIQFGLAPVARQAVKDCDVTVCSSDIDAFLQGGFLEVGVMDKKEEKKRISRKKSVELARARLGEKGYHILYNNCEHFAYECVTGEKKCTQADDVRAMFRNLPIVDVYVATVPEHVQIKSVLPKEREKEIRDCGSEAVRREKYCVWRLLEYALNRSFGLALKKLSIEKNEHGKWTSPDIFFSLSHANGVVTVAVSRSAVGVDVELLDERLVRVIPKYLTEKEIREYEQTEDAQKLTYLAQRWTQKESIFKAENEDVFRPLQLDTEKYPARYKPLHLLDKDFMLCVTGEHADRMRLYTNVEYLK